MRFLFLAIFALLTFASLPYSISARRFDPINEDDSKEVSDDHIGEHKPSDDSTRVVPNDLDILSFKNLPNEERVLRVANLLNRFKGLISSAADSEIAQQQLEQPQPLRRRSKHGPVNVEVNVNVD